MKINKNIFIGKNFLSSKWDTLGPQVQRWRHEIWQGAHALQNQPQQTKSHCHWQDSQVLFLMNYLTKLHKDLPRSKLCIFAFKWNFSKRVIQHSWVVQQMLSPGLKPFICVIRTVYCGKFYTKMFIKDQRRHLWLKVLSKIQCKYIKRLKESY